MNLILTVNSFPMAVIRNEDRISYLGAVNRGQIKNDLSLFYKIVEQAVDRSLTAYLKAAKGRRPLPYLTPETKKKRIKEELLKIGELAKKTEETVSTIRHWTNEGLLKVKGHTKGGYQLYEPAMIEQVGKIRRLQKRERLLIAEIKKEL